MTSFSPRGVKRSSSNRITPRRVGPTAALLIRYNTINQYRD